MRCCHRALLLILGFMETFLFGGVIFGWGDIVYVLKKEGIYKCEQNTTNGCWHQDNLFNVAFTIGATATGASGLLTAWILDHMGLKISRVIANMILISGGVLLALTGDWPHTLIPGIFLIGFGGGQTYRNNILIANLFPRRRSSVIALYSGAFLASASVLLGLKYAYDGGMAFRNCFLIWSAMTLMMLMTTLFLPTPLIPRARRTRKLQKSQKDTYHLLPVRGEEEYSSGHESGDDPVAVKDGPDVIKKPLSFVKTACSGAFIIHMFWACVLNLLMLEYNGSFNKWLHQASLHVDRHLWHNYTEHLSNDSFEVMLEDTADTESWMSTLYGFYQIPMVVIAPIAGIIMDFSLKRAQRELDPGKLQSKSQRSGFCVVMLTTFLALLLNICFFYPSSMSIKISLGLYIVVRSFSHAAMFSYIRLRFPPELFNRLTGLMETVVAIAGLLQVPIFMASTTNPKLVHSLMTGAVVFAFCNPFSLLFSV